MEYLDLNRYLWESLSYIESGQEVYQNWQFGTLPVAAGNKQMRPRYTVMSESDVSASWVIKYVQ